MKQKLREAKVVSNQQPLISIVTPVYNGAQYLAECIESVLAQSYENWEYVIVNNCSTDDSLKISKHYAKKDSRIRIYENKNYLQIVDNFNKTMDQVSDRSKYCKVLHADDMLMPSCLADMVALNEKHPSVGIVGAYVLEGVRIKCAGLPLSISVLPGREIGRLSLLGRSPVKGGLYVFGSPTSLLIRTDLVFSRTPFYRGKYLEVLDQEVCYHLLQNADFGFVHQVLTYSRVHDAQNTLIHERLMRRYFEEFMLLKEYGPVYLNEDEYNKCTSLRLEKYQRFLATNVFEGKGKEFWDFHKNAFSILGFPFKWSEIAKRASKKRMIQKFLRWPTKPKLLIGRILNFPKNGEKESF